MKDFWQLCWGPNGALNIHRPVVGWAVAYIIGAFWGALWVSPRGWLGAMAVLLAGAFLWKSRTVRTLLLCMAFLCISGWRAASVTEANLAVRETLQHYQETATPIALKVIVGSDCRRVERQRGRDYCQFSAEDAWLEDGREIKDVMLSFNYYSDGGVFPKAGELWQLTGKIYRRPFRQRLTLSVQEAQAQHIEAGDQTNHWVFRIARFREQLAHHLTLGVHSDCYRQTQAMLLGGRTRLDYETRQRYADAGIIHIFAISGLHVGIVAGFLIWFIRRIGVGLRKRALVLFPTLLFYLALTGFPPSAVRACVMALIYAFAPTFNLRSDATSALFLTAIGVLAYNPAWVYNVGAVLSFCVFGGILLYFKPLAYFFNFLFCSRVHERDPEELPEPPGAWMRLRRGLAALLALTLSAWLASFALSLFYFGRISMVGLGLNLFVPFVTLLIVWCSCMSTLVGFFCVPLCVFFNRLSDIFLTLIGEIANRMLLLPGAVVEVSAEHRPGPIQTLVMIGALIVLGLACRVWERMLRDRDPLDPDFSLALDPPPSEAPSKEKKSGAGTA